jgi:hypothetical protein
MIPHIQLSSNWVLALVLVSVLSLLWKIGSTVVIFTLYMIRSRHAARGPFRDRYIHISMIALSYMLMMILSVSSLCWDLYHYDISCWCFPLLIRICITIPAMAFGDYATWKMIRYQLHAPIIDNALE